jgi:hypothetical protein
VNDIGDVPTSCVLSTDEEARAQQTLLLETPTQRARYRSFSSAGQPTSTQPERARMARRSFDPSPNVIEQGGAGVGRAERYIDHVPSRWNWLEVFQDGFNEGYYRCFRTMTKPYRCQRRAPLSGLPLRDALCAPVY